MNKQQEFGSFEEFMAAVNTSDNSHKVALAFITTILEMTKDGPPDKKDIANFMLKGLDALRASVIVEVYSNLTDDGKALSVPNNEEELKVKAGMTYMLAMKFSDLRIKAFFEEAVKKANGRVAVQYVDGNDPRISSKPQAGESLH